MCIIEKVDGASSYSSPIEEISKKINDINLFVKWTNRWGKRYMPTIYGCLGIKCGKSAAGLTLNRISVSSICQYQSKWVMNYLGNASNLERQR